MDEALKWQCDDGKTKEYGSDVIAGTTLGMKVGAKVVERA
jgi:hypothetical protein